MHTAVPLFSIFFFFNIVDMDRLKHKHTCYSILYSRIPIFFFFLREGYQLLENNRLSDNVINKYSSLILTKGRGKKKQ